MTRALFLILLLAVALRVGVALYLGDVTPPEKDETSYSMLGARVAAGYGFSFDQGWYPFTPANMPTAHWSFLQALLIAAVYAAVGVHPLAVRLLTALAAGILLPYITYRLSLRVFNVSMFPRSNVETSRRTALLAAGLSAVYAYFVLYGAMLQTEAFFIIALLWTLERALALSDGNFQLSTLHLQHAVTLGLSLGVATLLRQSILPWVVVLFAWLLWNNVQRSQRASRALLGSVSTLALAGVVMMAFILPFTLRNYRVYGQFLLLNSNAGYAMYSAQHPMHGTNFQPYAAAPLPADLVSRGLNEAQWDRELMRRGMGFVVAEPARYLRLSLSRVADYFEFWPTADSSLLYNVGRVASIGLFLPFMLAGVVLAVRRQWAASGGGLAFTTTPIALTLLFVVFYSLLHIFTWAMERYRLPVDAVLVIFAAYAIRRFTVGANDER